VAKWRDAIAKTILIDMDDEIEIMLLHDFIAEGDHLFEIPGGINMQERERDWGGVEGFPCQVKNYGGIFSD
jgi:hypothetical protein